MTGYPHQDKRYFEGAPLLFAHRGGAALAPENTMEAFRNAVDVWGADVLELDVQRTADGALVVIHDETVDRTTDGVGLVSDFTLPEIRDLDAGARFVDRNGGRTFAGRGVRVPVFQDVLEAFPDTRLNVDAKTAEAAPELIRLVRAAGAQDRVLLASVTEQGRADRLGYEGPTSATRRQLRLFYYLHLLPRGGPYRPRTDALQMPYEWRGRRVVGPRFIREAHRRGLPVHVWTVDDPDVMRALVAWNVDGIQTDRPDLLARVLYEEAGRPRARGMTGEAE